MINEKETIKCEAIFNDEHTHRFLWRRVWNKDKPLACVIMLNPCMADGIITDTTTYITSSEEISPFNAIAAKTHITARVTIVFTLIKAAKFFKKSIYASFLFVVGGFV